MSNSTGTNNRKNSRKSKAMGVARSNYYDPDAVNNLWVGTDEAMMRQAGRTPFPARYFCTLRYSRTLTLTASSTVGHEGYSGTEKTFLLTSLYAPDQNAGSHQPYGYDQVTPLYFYYQVKRVRAMIRFTTIGGTHDMCCVVCVRAPGAGYTTSDRSSDALTENPAITTTVLSPASLGGRAVGITLDILPWNVLGVSRKSYLADQTQFASLVSASPTTTPVLAVNASVFDGTAGETCQCQVTLLFSCEFYNRKLQDTS